MKKFVAFASLLFSLSVAFAQDKPEGLFINSKAYDFKAKDQNGNEITLKDLRKKLLYDFNGQKSFCQTSSPSSV